LEPTWYQIATETTGALRSSCTITRKPLGRVNCVYGMSMPAVAEAANAGVDTMPPDSAAASAMPSKLARGRKATDMANPMERDESHMVAGRARQPH